MPRIALLACLIALAAPVPAWAGGVVRFAGSVVEAPCDASQPVPGEVLLADCPLAAQGSTLTVTELDRASRGMLVYKATGAATGTIGTMPGDMAAGADRFSSEYRIEPDARHAPGAYLVSIDYL